MKILNKIKKYCKKNQSLILAFIIPILIMIVSLLLNNFYPFGKKILLMLDGYNQYPGFLNNFMDVIKQGNSIFYSFSGFLGFNSYANSVYYSLNITNLIYLLFNSNTLNFYTFIIIFKIGLCSLTMTIFLNYFKKNKLNFLFGICYGLSAYNLLYYSNYMWFDSIILLPLVVLGIEKIFKENKYKLYVISLFMAILTNFYMGYMICIFSLLYFIYKSIIIGFNKKRILYYIISSLLSGLLPAFIILPVALELLNGKGAYFKGYSADYFNFDLDFINVFYKLTLGSYSNGDMEYGNPNVYVTMFIFMNLIIYFFNKEIKLKERLVSLGLLLFFLLSMSFTFLDYFWHMLQLPIWYPVRYGFIFDFYIIFLAYRNFLNIDKITFKKILISVLLIIVLISVGFFTAGNLNEKQNVLAKSIYLGISILLLGYYAFIINNKNTKMILIIFFIIEVMVNTYLVFKNNGNSILYKDYQNKLTSNTEIISSLNMESFDRLTFENKTIKNNGLFLNYNDINFFTSVSNSKTIKVLQNVFGFSTNDNCNVNYFYNNVIANALLNIKYYVSEDVIDYYKQINQYKNYYVYENTDASGIGFAVNNNINNIELNDDYITNINNLVKAINNNDIDIIKEVKPTDKNVVCYKNSGVCIINGGDPYILYEYTASTKEFVEIVHDKESGNKSKTKYTIYINDELVGNNAHIPYLLNKNDTIKVNIEYEDNFKDYDFHFYTVNYKVYETMVQNINKEILKITNYESDSHFSGEIELKEDATLSTSIDNDNGWSVYVDGKRADITEIADGLLGIKLTSGKHEIEFKYITPGIYYGLMISGISTLTLGGTYLFLRKTKKC